MNILEGCCKVFPRLEEIGPSKGEANKIFFDNFLVILKQSKWSYLKVIPKLKDDEALPACGLYFIIKG
jgi:hypothetical protein